MVWRAWSSAKNSGFQELASVDRNIEMFLEQTTISQFPGPLHQNEVKCSAFDMEMIFHCHSNKTNLHKKDCALGLVLKVRVFGTRKWLIDFIGDPHPF